jgi:hypothetical protein
MQGMMGDAVGVASLGGGVGTAIQAPPENPSPAGGQIMVGVQIESTRQPVHAPTVQGI